MIINDIKLLHNVYNIIGEQLVGALKNNNAFIIPNILSSFVEILFPHVNETNYIRYNNLFFNDTKKNVFKINEFISFYTHFKNANMVYSVIRISKNNNYIIDNNITANINSEIKYFFCTNTDHIYLLMFLDNDQNNYYFSNHNEFTEFKFSEYFTEKTKDMKLEYKEHL